ncbi:uncharacterized protein KY384_009093 [Bacidia gigantensis]|uniref:uncharacterized protein n=1 Tax=Bacidia gigantensis TaxID=2732470 RepID=UPI001D0421D5|nr:uncharacterized protein KY384_009093 [Bacidia gigantensis]KAG8525449.1 hypothetical protein KY384_009093 [Bacidia gigantensis]
MTSNAEGRKPEREVVDEHKRGLNSDDSVDEAREHLAGEDRMLFYSFRQIVKPTSYEASITGVDGGMGIRTNGKSQETKAHYYTKIAHQGYWNDANPMGSRGFPVI